MSIELRSVEVNRRLHVWADKGDRHESGNVAVVLVSFEMIGDYRLETWGVQLRIDGVWRWAHAKSRPYGYGSSGAAKRGISKWSDPVIGEAA